MNKEEIAAVIPVRAGSRRLANKNILPFGKSNLLVHKIRQLKQVENINKIVVSSDSDEMLQMALDEGVNIHKREDAYCDEVTKTFNEVVVNICESLSSDIIMWTPCVCPLTTADSYTKAIDNYINLIEKESKFDSVISAKSFKEYLFDEKGPLNWNPEKHVPSQFLPEWRVIVNGFYIARRENMLKWKYFYGPNPYLQILDKKEAVDIDDREDFEIAKALLGME